MEYVENLIDDYISKGMKLTKKLDELIFSNSDSIYVYSYLLEKGYIFKNMLTVLSILQDLSKELNKPIDYVLMTDEEIFEYEEEQKKKKQNKIIS
jgi:hypothetical protein